MCTFHSNSGSGCRDTVSHHPVSSYTVLVFLSSLTLHPYINPLSPPDLRFFYVTKFVLPCKLRRGSTIRQFSSFSSRIVRTEVPLTSFSNYFRKNDHTIPSNLFVTCYLPFTERPLPSLLINSPLWKD